MIRETEERTGKYLDYDVIYWNTGNMYTAKGQRIVALAFRDGLLFFDIDRGVHGYLWNCNLNKRTVMSGYNHNVYSPSPDEEAWKIERDFWDIGAIEKALNF